MPAPTINSIVDRALRAIKRDAIPAVLRRRGDQSEIDMDRLGAIIREAVTSGSQLGVVARVKASPALDAAAKRAAFQATTDRINMVDVLDTLRTKCGHYETRELIERNSGATNLKDTPADKVKTVTRAARIKLAAVRRAQGAEEL